MKSYTDLMIDLETYGIEPGCVILEVGLVAFDRNNADRRVMDVSLFPDLMEQQNMGFTINHDTMAFWMQHPEAYNRQLSAQRMPVDLTAIAITEFWKQYCNEKSLIWAKGTHFDMPILRTIHKEPWSFRQIHDMRTLQLMMPHDIAMPKSELSHGAVEDARCQAKGVQLICSTIGTAF